MNSLNKSTKPPGETSPRARPQAQDSQDSNSDPLQEAPPRFYPGANGLAPRRPDFFIAKYNIRPSPLLQDRRSDNPTSPIPEDDTCFLPTNTDSRVGVRSSLLECRRYNCMRIPSLVRCKEPITGPRDPAFQNLGQMLLRERHSHQVSFSIIDEMKTRIDETKEMMEGLASVAKDLPEIKTTLADLTAFAKSNKRNMLALDPQQVSAVKETFECLICRDVMTNPMVTSCCRSFIGCRACVMQCVQGGTHCPKCRSETFEDDVFEITGMDDIISILSNIIMSN